MSNRVIGLIAMLATVIIWGISFISIEQTVNIFRPMSLGLYRFTIAFIVLNLFTLTKLGKIQKLDKKDMPLFFAAGVVGITVYFFFENNGVMLSNASSASLIIATVPVFTMVMESLVYKTPIRGKLVFSIILSLIGVYYIVGVPLKEIMLVNNSLLGNLFMLGAVFSFAIYSIITKPLFKKYNQSTITYYQVLFGLLMFLPFIIREKVQFELIDISVLMHLMFLGILASATGYYLYIIAMNNLGISLSALLLNAIPIVTVIVANIFYNEVITTNKIVGGLLVITAVILATYGPSTKPQKT